MERMTVTRREFLQTSGALLVVVSSAHTQTNDVPRSIRNNSSLDTWLRVNKNGTVDVCSGKVELGQGILTALGQVTADELNINITRVQMVAVDTDRSPDEGRTVGSNSVPNSANALRAASAHARELLLENAADRLSTVVGELSINDGVITDRRSSRSISYWQLLSDGRFNVEVDGSASLLNKEDYRYTGVEVPRFDIPGKVLGSPSYVHDIRLPGMLHARLVRAPRAGGVITSIDIDSVSSRPGVRSVIQNGNFLAVVAHREGQATDAAAQLRSTVTWENNTTVHGSAVDAHLLRELDTVEDEISNKAPDGSVVSKRYERKFSKPFLSHASLGPSCAVALYQDGKLTVWNHSQGQHQLKGAISDVLGLSLDDVRLVHEEGPGCYGHNGADDVACDAAMIAIEMPGTPIRLLWSRSDEFLNEPYGSGMSFSVSVGVDDANRINHWHCDLWSCSFSTRPSGGPSAGGLLASQEKTNPLPKPPVSDGRQPTGGADRNLVPLYDFTDQKIIEHLVQTPPLRNSALRGLGAFGNVFVIESMMSIVAHDLGEDPVEFRLKHLSSTRAREVIVAASELANKAPELNIEGLVGRGIAFAQYKNLSTYVAVVLDVVVNPNTGGVRVVRAFSAADAGEIINPDGVRNQIEGGIVQATSWALKERVLASNNGSQTADWNTYPILRFTEVPEIEVTLINRPNESFLGAGEGTQGPTGAAIANAIFNATGARLYDMPFTPEKVLAAMSR